MRPRTPPGATRLLAAVIVALVAAGAARVLAGLRVGTGAGTSTATRLELGPGPFIIDVDADGTSTAVVNGVLTSS